MRIHLTIVEVKEVSNSLNSYCDIEEINKTPLTHVLENDYLYQAS